MAAPLRRMPPLGAGGLFQPLQTAWLSAGTRRPGPGPAARGHRVLRPRRGSPVPPALEGLTLELVVGLGLLVELLAHLEVRHDPRLRLHRRRCERERREVTAAPSRAEPSPAEPSRAARSRAHTHTQRRRPPRLGLVVRPGAGPASSARCALQLPPGRAAPRRRGQGRAGPAAVSRGRERRAGPATCRAPAASRGARAPPLRSDATRLWRQAVTRRAARDVTPALGCAAQGGGFPAAGPAAQPAAMRAPGALRHPRVPSSGAGGAGQRQDAPGQRQAPASAALAARLEREEGCVGRRRVRGGPNANSGEMRRQERAGRGWEFILPGTEAIGVRGQGLFALFSVRICSAKRLPSNFLCLYRWAKAHKGGRERGNRTKHLRASWVSVTGSRNSLMLPHLPRRLLAGLGNEEQIISEHRARESICHPRHTHNGRRDPARTRAGGCGWEGGQRGLGTAAFRWCQGSEVSQACAAPARDKLRPFLGSKTTRVEGPISGLVKWSCLAFLVFFALRFWCCRELGLCPQGRETSLSLSCPLTRCDVQVTGTFQFRLL